ncbi:glycosyltransferase family protein [Brevibacterium samyangense]|uniref:Glycosyltransferase n=1 Tax=Brevibacterium samyangense TaxID=366888 RepID=A0ABN2TP64_9MICO
MTRSSVLGELRTAAWHLRRGGLAQLREWQRRRGAAAGNPRLGVSDDPLERFPATTGDDRAPVFAGIRVGTILDEFSASAFRYEWTTVPLTRTGWAEQLPELDLVFIESAWNGNGGDWQYQLTGTSGVKQPFIDLLAACREAGIPTVFWNKEDPPHFDDFLEAAKLFDVVFTSDVRLIPRYREELGHDRVGVLGFAAQPAIHNPVRPVGGFHEDGVAFAGMYFAHKYPERREQMDWLLGGAVDAEAKSGERFSIFSRQLGGDERYQFPGELGEHVVGSLPYPHMLTAYKGFKAFLNVNSVVDSPSMCARRIFEITASGTPVVTAPSAATKAFFPENEVFQPTTRSEASDVLRALVRSPELSDRSVHLAQRRIWAEHTYTQRAMTVMDAAGVPYEDPGTPTVSVLVSTNRPQQLDHVFASVGKQTYPHVQLVLVTHGFDPSAEPAEVRSAEGAGSLEARAASAGVRDLVHVVGDASLSLGECLNLAIDAASGSVLTKMDDDDLYGQHYLADQVAALRYSNADLVGKQAHYLHLGGQDVTLLRFPEREHKFTNLVMGPTMTGRAEVFRRLRFGQLTRGEDTDFQQRLLESGGRIYSADRFNFVQMRSHDDGHRHTWDVEDTHLLANGTVHAYGFPEEHYFF